MSHNFGGSLPPKRFLTVFTILRAVPNCSIVFFSAVDSNDNLFSIYKLLRAGIVLHSTFSLFFLYTALVFRSIPRDLTLSSSATPCRSGQPHQAPATLAAF